ncbi:MAG: TRAP transporter permease [Bacillota bacterium]
MKPSLDLSGGGFYFWVHGFVAKKTMKGVLNIKRLIGIIAVIWSIFQLYSVSFGVFDAIRLRAWHIVFLLIMVFLLYPIGKRDSKYWKVLAGVDVLCIVLSVSAYSYLLINYTSIALRGGYLLPIDYFFGAVGILMVFEAARRVVGNLAVLALIFFIYNLFGAYIPGSFGHSGFSWKRIIEHMFWGSQGILGIGIGVSATFVFLFILFGAFLRISGFSNFINDLSITIAGRSAGGPAKVAVLASSLMGMINGSALANVATTGAITIPMMKKNGYKPEYAAAVEAVASTGGQFAPPIMGAVGFIMAEYLGVTYTKVMIAAIIPAFLYYVTLIFAVHYEAKQRGLKGLGKEDIPRARDILRSQGFLILPLIVLIVMLLAGYTPVYAAVFSILATVVASWMSKETRMGPKAIIQSLEEGAKGAVGVGVACAIIGVIIGTVSLTGFGLTFGYKVLEFAGNNLFLAALMVAFMSIILGMGVPGIAAYVIVATVAAPVLTKLGVAPMAAHMFVLIYACLSNITPPVALSSYVAAGLAGADQNRTSYIAIRLGLTGFIIPFFFIFDPVLLFDGKQVWQSLLAAATATVGVTALASGIQGWLMDKTNLIQRLGLFVIAYLTITPRLEFDIVGICLFAGIIAWQKFTIAVSRQRKEEVRL